MTLFATSLLCICATLALGAPSVKLDFDLFKIKYGKHYKNLEETQRRAKIFEENYLEVKQHNALPNVTYLKGINQFSDMTEEEFKQRYLGFVMPNIKIDSANDSSEPVEVFLNMTDGRGKDKEEGELEEKDWEKDGVITEVKNQGSCGSCWAFAAIEQIESYFKIENPKEKLTELSAQQVTSCTISDSRNWGCGGGLEKWAFEDLKGIGITSEEEYPYTDSIKKAEKDQTSACVNGKPAVVTIHGYREIDRRQVLSHLANKGPLNVSMNGNKIRSYASGIFPAAKCETSVNHSVQLVGYGRDYWLVRNSWGKTWGDEGYIRLQRSKGAITENETCGIFKENWRINYPTGVKKAEK